MAKPSHHKATWKIGQALISFGLILLIFTLFPLIFPIKPQESKIVQNPLKNYRIEIPKISAHAVIVLNVNPYDKSEYQKALEKGVAHAKGSSIPNQGGTSFLFAHSNLPPWKITQVNTPFLKLSALAKNDLIIISENTVNVRYLITDIKNIPAEDIQYLSQNQKDELIVMTCYPPGTAWRRLLVFARKENELRAEQKILQAQYGKLDQFLNLRQSSINSASNSAFSWLKGSGNNLF